MRFAVVHPKNARVLFYALFVLLPQRAGDSGPGGKNTVARGKKSMPPNRSTRFGELTKNTSVKKEDETMNKTFFTKITAAAISLALLVTAFSACGKEAPEYETDTAPETSQTAAN